MRAWIDIDNPPQVQYVAPFIDSLRARGLEVVVTARDYGITRDLLRGRGIEHQGVGSDFGGGRAAKLAGTAGRAARLVALVGRGGRPALLLSTSRSAAMAAWTMRVPSFMVLDYEHAELASFRTFGTTVLHPAAIDGRVFLDKGFRPDRLVAFDGIKEDISFAGRDLDAVEPHDFGVDDEPGVARVLVRPPSDTSHYFQDESARLADAVLARLAAVAQVRVVFAPRRPEQLQALARHAWALDPIPLERPVEFLSLLRAVDWVVSAGGTMVREAAYLGVPTISILRSEIGAVDRYLERSGALRIIQRSEDLDDVDWTGPTRRMRIPHRPEVLDELTDRLLELSRR